MNKRNLISNNGIRVFELIRELPNVGIEPREGKESKGTYILKQKTQNQINMQKT